MEDCGRNDTMTFKSFVCSQDDCGRKVNGPPKGLAKSDGTDQNFKQEKAEKEEGKNLKQALAHAEQPQATGQENAGSNNVRRYGINLHSSALRSQRPRGHRGSPSRARRSGYGRRRKSSKSLCLPQARLFALRSSSEIIFTGIPSISISSRRE